MIIPAGLILLLDKLAVVSDKIHAETGRAWDIVAQTKYEAEIGERVRLLRAGGHTLLPPEVEALSPL